MGNGQAVTFFFSKLAWSEFADFEGNHFFVLFESVIVSNECPGKTSDII